MSEWIPIVTTIFSPVLATLIGVVTYLGKDRIEKLETQVGKQECCINTLNIKQNSAEIMLSAVHEIRTDIKEMRSDVNDLKMQVSLIRMRCQDSKHD
jgi:uncharacterized coiled-coil protein SlyX